MGVRSKGRGTAAAIGLFILFAGLVGGGVLYVVSQQRPSRTVDGFARAPIGCTTTLEFSEIGTFYVFEEAGIRSESSDAGCSPVATPGDEFGIEFTSDLQPELTSDTTVSYDVDGFDGRSVQRVEITEPGEYSVAVTGSDLTVVAALGRDPNEGIDDLRRTGLIVAIAGIVLGLLLLTLSGRRSKRAAVLTTPEGPGWGTSTPRPASTWPPETPTVDQVPVNPHEPLVPAKADLAPRPTSDPTTWTAPSGDALPLPPPDPEAPPAPPVESSDDDLTEPVLPDAPGRTSGT